MKSFEDELYIKIIELNEIYNYVDENFDLKSFRVTEVDISSQILKFQI
jgi:hypothetical protein